MSNFCCLLRGKFLIYPLTLSYAVFTPFCLYSQTSQERDNVYAINDPLTMREYMQRVVDFNLLVQSKLLGFQAARRIRMAELGSFEPAFSASGEWVDRLRPNASVEARTQGFVDAALQAAINGEDPPPKDLYPYILEERSRRYSSGIEMLTPVGTRFRIGATGAEIFESGSPPSLDNPTALGFATSVGLSLEQPLLKGLGLASNLASLRLAARQSEIAFQEYRRELMQVVAEAELAYWDLYYAQEEYKLTRESVALAQTLLDDLKAKFDAGRGSMLDVLEAEAGLAIRKSRQSEAYQKSIEMMNRMASFFGGVPKLHQIGYIVIDAPVSQPVETSFQHGIETAMEWNPDVQRAKLKVEQEQIRLGYAKNRRLPELNLTAGVDMSGHGNNWHFSYMDIEDYSFPAWRVGLVFRVPLGGDIRGRNEMYAARLRLMEMQREMANLVNQMRAGCDTAGSRIESNYTTARSHESVVEHRLNLLETRMQQRDIGRMDARSVLEAEQELFVARLEQLHSEIQYQRALLEFQIITGSILKLRDIDMEFDEVDEDTSGLAKKEELLSTGLLYRVPDLNKLTAIKAEPFAGDPVSQPWFGVNWKPWDWDFGIPYIFDNSEESQ